LEDVLALDAAALADGAVDRAHQVGGGDRPGAGLEGAGEEVVEGGIAADVRIQRLVHVDAIAGNEPADRGGGEGAAARAGEPAGQGREGALRKDVLRQDEGAGHAGSAGCSADSIGWRRWRRSTQRDHPGDTRHAAAPPQLPWTTG